MQGAGAGVQLRLFVPVAGIAGTSVNTLVTDTCHISGHITCHWAGEIMRTVAACKQEVDNQ